VFLPIGDAPNPRGVPWVTWGLIALNVFVYVGLLPATGKRPLPSDPRVAHYVRTLDEVYGRELALQVAAQVTVYDLIVFEHGFKPQAPELLDLFASMFLHGGMIHLLGNMLFLWIFGNNVEARAGPGWFLAGYLLAGVLAALGDAVLRMGSPLPAVGASGAISGVLGAYYLLFPGNVVRVAVFLFPFVLDVWELRARLVLGFYVLVQNLLPALIAAGEGGVSYGAHLGGFVAGLGLAWLVPRDPSGEAGAEGRFEALLEAGYALAQAGRPVEAYQHAFAAWNQATTRDSRDRAAELMRRLQTEVRVPRRYLL